MSDTPDAAYVLFPNDAPKSVQMPEWAQVQRSAAEMRLAGVGHGDKPDSAAIMFPNEGPKEEQAPSPAGDNADAASVLFKDDVIAFDEKPVEAFFDGFALSALSDGDKERGEELKAASTAIIADATAAGTDAKELAAALDVVRERQGDALMPLTPEKLEADFAAGMTTMQAELGDGYMSEINMARAFIRDMEIVAPGTIDSLERSGAGNDPRLIRAAIKEAKRRGYR